MPFFNRRRANDPRFAADEEAVFFGRGRGAGQGRGFARGLAFGQDSGQTPDGTGRRGMGRGPCGMGQAFGQGYGQGYGKRDGRGQAPAQDSRAGTLMNRAMAQTVSDPTGQRSVGAPGLGPDNGQTFFGGCGMQRRRRARRFAPNQETF
jgi:hypothetical protein